ncbi:hypothetical protein GUY61_35255, partial [Streptomyces sp. GC420]|nr:hypothetical protein [Streptomyces sp. GC420]
GEPDPSADRPGLTPATVEALDDMAAVFAALTQRRGGAHARTALAEYLATEAVPLLTAPAPTEPLRRRVFTGVARLTLLLGGMCLDAGAQGLAQHYYRTGHDLARDAADDLTRAVALRAMSSQARVLEDHERALRLAEAAVDLAGPNPPPGVHAFLLAQRAVTLADRGDRRGALDALARAEAAHERASRRGGAFTTYSRAGLHHQAGEALSALGDPAASAAYEASVRHRAPGHHRQLALTRARLAEAELRAGELERACHHWDAFLGSVPYVPASCPVRRALRQLRSELNPHRTHPLARAVLARAATLAP